MLEIQSKNAEYHISEMLTDGRNCYIADFGWDLGSPTEKLSQEMYKAGTDLIKEEYIDMFEKAYQRIKEPGSATL